MKAKTITMQIVKNLGNYETVRFEIEYELLPGDGLENSFLTAKNELENAFKNCYKKNNTNQLEKRQLKFETPEFLRVCKALNKGTTNLVEVEKYFYLSKEIMDYLKTNKLC